MSKYLELMNSLVSVESTCKEPMPSGGLKKDRYMEACGIIRKAGITHDEWLYGMAVVGDGFEFEALIQQKARIRLALSMELSCEKLAKRSAGLAELVIAYLRGKNNISSEICAEILGVKKWSWHNKYKDVYTELCQWSDDLHIGAIKKVSIILGKEMVGC